MWEPTAQVKVTTWQHIQSSVLAQPLTLFGPNKESGLFDSFTVGWASIPRVISSG
jgi:phosphate transport system substrate-binding protein